MKTSVPRLAVFPKAYMHALCRDGSMKLSDWLNLAAKLNVDGVEWYAGFLEMQEKRNWSSFRKLTEELGMEIPMMCCSPDFTSPDARFRENEIVKQKYWIGMTAALGGSYCRVLSGQRRPSVSIRDGLTWAKESILSCLPFAKERGITLILENHYKDDFWEYPEFAQQMEIFCELVNSIEEDGFGVNYDPSNAWLAGDDPLELLKRISTRVITMHASDRYLKAGTLQDLRNEEMGAAGYASRLVHGEIGKGLNNYDAIFSELKKVGFSGWISVEDGIDGFDQLERSVAFLKKKINEYWGS
jgi:sugar phosphate isomerase/epimerase